MPLCSVTTSNIGLNLCGVLNAVGQIARVAGLFSAEIQLPKLNFFDPLQAALAAASAGDATGSQPIGSRVCSVSTNESARLTGILGEGPSKVTVTAKMITCNHSQMKSDCFFIQE